MQYDVCCRWRSKNTRRSFDMIGAEKQPEGSDAAINSILCEYMMASNTPLRYQNIYVDMFTEGNHKMIPFSCKDAYHNASCCVLEPLR